jgi:hypothetical protein
MKFPNARDLYNFVKERPEIKKVLDLGTGIGASVATIALAMQNRESGSEGCHIDSIEQFDKCIKIASDLIPPELLSLITIHKVNAVAWQTDKISCQYFSVYSSLPESDYNLIINDGPAPFLQDGHYLELPNGTITKLLLEEKLKPGTFIAWDGRVTAIKLLERYFGDNFFLIKPACPGSDFNIIQRKDNPIAFRDERYETMKDNTTYFK